jgi:hypothetical protein
MVNCSPVDIICYSIKNPNQKLQSFIPTTMKTIIKSLTTGILAGMAFVTLCGTARADITVTADTSNIATWDQANGQNPFYYTALSGSGQTAQGQPSANAGAISTVLGETITVTNGAGTLTSITGNTNYVLTGIAVIGNTLPTNSSIHIYDVTGTLTSNNGTPLQGSGATYTFTTNGDLLGGGNGLWFNTSALPGQSQILFSLTTGPNTDDQIVLGTNHTYAIELWDPTTGSGSGTTAGTFTWNRFSGADPGGQAMGSHDSSLGVARLTITSLGLAGGAPRTFCLALYGSPTSAKPSANTNILNNVGMTNFIIDAFNPTNTNPTIRYIGTNTYNLGQLNNVWTNWPGYGNPASVTWDSTQDAYGSANSGSMEITANFSSGGQFMVFDGFNGIAPALSCWTNGITSFQCDVKFANTSPTTINSSLNVTNYGHLVFGMAVGSTADPFGSIEIPVGTTNWQHVNITLSMNTDPNLLTISDVYFNIDGGWYGSTPLNGTTTLWVDNVKFVGPTNYVTPGSPVLSILKATPGLRMFAGSPGVNDRVELATVDANQSWVAATSGSPVSYSFSLLSYPANINQTMIFLVPENSIPPTGNGPGNSGSVNMYVEYQASNAVWLDLQPFSGGLVTATVEWKTNLPNANPNHTMVLLTNSALSTWTLKFTSANGGMVTAVTPTNSISASFTIADPNAATDFANPLVAYFGLQPNGSTGIGQYEDWASISVTNVAGVNENDDFTTDTSLKSMWAINVNSSTWTTCVQLVTTNTPYWINWTIPTLPCALGVATDLLAPNSNTSNNTPNGWMLPEYYNYYNDGNNPPNQANQGPNKAWVLMPLDCLPTLNGQPGGVISPTAFFQLFSPPLAY